MKLLIIDDDALVCASLKTILETDPQVKVVGTGGRLTGYAGGVDRKAGLLELEHSGLCIPRRGALPGEKS